MQAAWPWQTGVLDPQGPIGAAERTILLDSTTIMLAVIVPVIVLTLAFAWWFRAGNEKAIHLPDWDFSGRIEVVVWSIPALIVGFLGGIAWLGISRSRSARRRSSPMSRRSMSRSYRWTGNGCSSTRTSMSPASTGSSSRRERRISFRITSATVMNSFFVPQLGSHDLRDVRDDHSTCTCWPTGPERIPGLSCAVQRRWVRRHAFRLGRDSISRALRTGSRRRVPAGASSTPRAYGQLARPARPCRRSTFGDVAPRIVRWAWRWPTRQTSRQPTRGRRSASAPRAGN